MSWDSVIGAVTEQMPPFNDYLLRGYRDSQVAAFADYIDNVFKDAVKLFGGVLKYHGHTSLNPQHRLESIASGNTSKGTINVQQSELTLERYLFEFERKEIAVNLYLPYIFHDALVINDTRNYVALAINDRVISRISDGVVIKVMRSPLHFWRTEQVTCTTQSGLTLFEPLLTVKAFQRKENGRVRTPLLLYLLSEYGFEETCNIFSIDQTELGFTDHVGVDDGYDYLKCKDGVWLRVHPRLLEDTDIRRVVVSLWYIVKSIRRRCSISELYSVYFYRIRLGKLLYPNKELSEALANSHAESHLSSLRTSLDRYTKSALALMNIFCADIFDLFITAFTHIDEWLTNYRPNDLFSKRISGVELVLNDVTAAIFNRFYSSQRINKRLAFKDINSMLRLDSMMISKITNKRIMVNATQIYNDNMLTNVLITKDRDSRTGNNRRRGSQQGSIINAREHRFDPSFLVVESALSISNSKAGKAGDINPYAVIDEHGCFVKEKMPWFKEVESLSRYLN